MTWDARRARPPRSTPAALRAFADIRALLDSPPQDTPPEVMLAELERRRREDEARRCGQGVLALGGPDER